MPGISTIILAFRLRLSAKVIESHVRMSTIDLVIYQIQNLQMKAKAKDVCRVYKGTIHIMY